MGATQGPRPELVRIPRGSSACALSAPAGDEAEELVAAQAVRRFVVSHP